MTRTLRPKPWEWAKVDGPNGGEWRLVDGKGRTRASIWWVGDRTQLDQYTWHTWDECGTGGENCSAGTLRDAKDLVVAAIVRQGWAPGGWTINW